MKGGAGFTRRFAALSPTHVIAATQQADYPFLLSEVRQYSTSAPASATMLPSASSGVLPDVRGSSSMMTASGIGSGIGSGMYTATGGKGSGSGVGSGSGAGGGSTAAVCLGLLSTIMTGFFVNELPSCDFMFNKP